MYLLILIAVVLLLYYKLIRPHNYWKDKGIQYIKPWPLFGHLGPYVLKMSSFPDIFSDLYNANPNRRYDGVFQFLQPTLLIRDLELIKQITIKEFDSFSELAGLVCQENDNLGKKTILFLTKETGWQDMRSILSPAFTSSKMKMIYDSMEECADQLVTYFMDHDKDLITVDLSKTYNRVTNDIIAYSALGFKCNSLKDQNNEFYRQGKKVMDRTGFQSLLFFISNIHPVFQKLLDVRLISAECEEFFTKLIKETMKYREDNKIVRNDVLHLLIEAKRNRLRFDEEGDFEEGFAVVQESEYTKTKKVKATMTDEDIIAQAILFFLAGFGGSSMSMSHVSYELAVNPDIQRRLQNEIDDALEMGNGKITYEALLKMKYLDCVISESLRLRCLGVNLSRRTTKPFTIEPKLPGEVPVHLKKGSLVWIPIWGIQLDPKYYPNPEKFDPERFNDQNKHTIHPQTYMPFGGGPRNCLGSRYALLQIKTVMVKVLANFNIVPVEKTMIPMKFEPGSLKMMPKGGLWLGFERRK